MAGPYSELEWLLEVRWPNRHAWEIMCAFNNEDVAKAYADECLKGKPDGWTYRVSERQSEDLTDGAPSNWRTIYVIGGEE